MLSVVLDTNILVSALILRGSTNQIANLWQNQQIKIVLCKEIFEEYIRVLAYPKFKLLPEEIQMLLEKEVLPYSHPVEVKKIIPVIQQDSSDDVFLACALKGNCKYIVSGDQHLLSLKTYQKIKIISAKDFLKLF